MSGSRAASYGVACLEARGVSFGYGRPGRLPSDLQVRNVDLVVRDGEMVGLLGPNGAGKTTLLRLLAGMVRPRSGTVLLFGRPLASLPSVERAREMAFVPQEFRPAFDFDVLELVLLGRSPHLGLLGIEGRRDVQIAREALAFTDSEHLAGRAFGNLSAGEKQRVLLARALAQQARVVLLDEPTAFLDIAHQVRTYELLARLCRERGTTLLIASHDLTLAGRTCARLVLMRDGELAAEGAPRDVLTPENIRAAYGVEAEVHFLGAGGVLGPVVVARGRPPGPGS